MNLGPHIKNHENAERIINWLINGSDDEYFFSIRYANNAIKKVDMEEIQPEDLPHSQPECGTVCCIAGMAAIMAGELTLHWPTCQKVALEWLGIPPTEDDYWPLFDPEYYHERDIRPTGKACANALIEYSHTGKISWD